MSEKIQEEKEFSVIDGPSTIGRFCQSLLGQPGGSTVNLTIRQDSASFEITVRVEMIARIHTTARVTEQARIFGYVWGGKMRGQKFELTYDARTRQGRLLIKSNDL